MGGNVNYGIEQVPQASAWAVIHLPTNRIVSGAESEERAKAIAAEYEVEYPNGPSDIDPSENAK